MLKLESLSRPQIEDLATKDAHDVHLGVDWSCSDPIRMLWYADAYERERDLHKALHAVGERLKRPLWPQIME